MFNARFRCSYGDCQDIASSTHGRFCSYHTPHPVPATWITEPVGVALPTQRICKSLGCVEVSLWNEGYCLSHQPYERDNLGKCEGCGTHVNHDVKLCVKCVGVTGGKKFDNGKDRMSLLPWKALRLIARVLTFGAKKYGANNWQEIEGERYEDALLRHYEAWRAGEWLDEESGQPHLAHLGCNALFLLAQEAGLDKERGKP